MGRVFISYSHNNFDFVNEINDELNKNQILTWFDKNKIKPNQNWEQHIKTAIYSSDVFIVFYSKDYQNSTYCQKEFKIAQSLRGEIQIIIISLDAASQSFLLDDDFSNIQRCSFNYLCDEKKCLIDELLSFKEIKECCFFDNETFNYDNKTNFLHGLSEYKIPKHYQMLELIVDFMYRIKMLEKQNKYLSSEIDIKDLVIIDDLTHKKRFIDVESTNFLVSNNENYSLKFIKKIIFTIFNFGYPNFDENISKLNFNSIYEQRDDLFSYDVGKKVLKYLNVKINETYLLSSFDLMFERFKEILQCSKYIERLNAIKQNKTSLIEYQINLMTLELSKLIFKEMNDINSILYDDCFPEIKCEDGKKYDTNDRLSSIIQNEEKDIFLYGENGCGKSCLMKKCFFDNINAIYIELDKVINSFDDDFIQYTLSFNASKYCYGLDYDNLYNFSTYEHKLILLLDNFDYLSENNKIKIINEIEKLKNSFKIVIFSSKRNFDQKIVLNDNNIFGDYAYYEILPLSKANILAYLKHKNIDENIINNICNLPDDHSLFNFFNTFSKLNILVQSLANVKYDETIGNDFSAETKIYNEIFLGTGEYSISKKISSLFNNEYVTIDDIILSLSQKELIGLKSIAYQKNYSEIEKYRFKNLFCRFNLLFKRNNKYFIVEDIEEYFIASYLYDKISENRENFDTLENLLLPFNNKYRILKYLSDFEVLDLIDVFELFLTKKYLNLKYILFKISQYNTVTAKMLKDIFKIEELPDNFFLNCENIVEVIIPSSVKEIGRGCFANMTRLKKLNLTSKAQTLTIKPWAIVNCNSLEEIIIGENYKEFNCPLVRHCYNLKRIIVSGDNQYFSSIDDNKLLVSKDYSKLYLGTNGIHDVLVLPSVITSLEENCLNSIINLKTIIISKNVTHIETDFADFCPNLEKIIVDKDNEHYKSDNLGYLYLNDGYKTLIRIPSGVKDDIYINEGVENIANDSFSCCDKVRYVFLPSSIKKIGNYAFADMTSIEKISFENYYHLEQLGNYIFLNSNANLQINNREDDSVINIEKFNKYINHTVLKKYTYSLNNKFNIDVFDEDFEVIVSSKNDRIYNNVLFLRANNLFDKMFKYSMDDYNILMIGLTEYNEINSQKYDEIEAYLNDILTKRYISLIVVTRDLPLFDAYFKLKDITIIRTHLGSTSATKKVLELINKLGEK